MLKRAPRSSSQVATGALARRNSPPADSSRMETEAWPPKVSLTACTPASFRSSCMTSARESHWRKRGDAGSLRSSAVRSASSRPRGFTTKSSSWGVSPGQGPSMAHSPWYAGASSKALAEAAACCSLLALRSCKAFKLQAPLSASSPTAHSSPASSACERRAGSSEASTGTADVAVDARASTAAEARSTGRVVRNMANSGTEGMPADSVPVGLGYAA
mmetsp:Transcript_47496/g.151548  ORF Transcript_47496/g.151548 Transcript_47496/m.151548 type:complete len:217 (+) Transcript_47496:1243-1893(+)